jgi:serine/threonine protein kinase
MGNEVCLAGHDMIMYCMFSYICFVIPAYFGEIYLSLEQRKLSEFVQAHIIYGNIYICRYKIVKGLCSALQYLHHDRPKYILHRDIKPSNILLDDEFNAKLGDFGLPRTAQHNDASSVRPTQVAARYMDPQCMKDGDANLRRSSDVYSFGIVLLEIAHGKYDAALFQKLHTGLPQTFVEDFADEKLDDQFDKGEMARVIILGLRCWEQDVSKRPSLDAETLRYLEKGGELRAARIHEDEPHPAIAPV